MDEVTNQKPAGAPPSSPAAPAPTGREHDENLARARTKAPARPTPAAIWLFGAAMFVVAVAAMFAWTHLSFGSVWIGFAAILAVLVVAVVRLVVARSRHQV